MAQMVPHVLLNRPLNVKKNELFGKKKGGKFMISEFKLGKSLGEGSFGEVFLAELKSDNTIKVAIKKIPKKKLTKPMQPYMITEIKNQVLIGAHPHILPLLDVFYTLHTVYIIMPVAPRGALSDKWLPNGDDQPAVRFSHHETAKYIFQIANAVEYCHGFNLVHRDLKLENILIDSNGNVQVCDFGSSVVRKNRKRGTRFGTVLYNAPEMVKGDEHGKEVDIWAIGIMIFEMLAAKNPFGDYDEDRIVENRILRLEYNIPADVDAAPARIIKRLLKLKPEERMKLSNLMKNPWIRANK